MSVSIRLWRRAPVWRVCLISAVAFSGLAAMFPPHWLAIPISTPTAPRFVPLTNAAPAQFGMIEMPPNASRSGVIPFAGKKLPLPDGSWREIGTEQGSGEGALQVLLLARIENQHLTGLEMAASPNPLNSSVSGFVGQGPCNAPNAISAQSIPVPGANPLAFECWALADANLAGKGSQLQHDPVLHRGLDRLQNMGVSVPDHMLVFSYLRSDETGWQANFLFLPPRREEAIRRLVAWVRRFAPLVHKGYLSSLTPPELAALPRDPT
jgi:hypothetical protein